MTPDITPEHECDLFLLSSHQPYGADRSLPEFARRGEQNVHGWGIGWYANDTAQVLRSAEPALERGDPSREFAGAVEAVSSPVILGHLRLKSRGAARPQNNHPFKLRFLGYDWLLIHNGTASRHAQLVPVAERLILDSDSDSPRVFEFLRQHIIDYCSHDPRKSLVEACRSAFSDLLDLDPQGGFNVILSNGHLTFAFIHYRRFYLLRREKTGGDVALLSTIRLADAEEWIEFPHPSGNDAKMLVFSGHTLVVNSRVRRR
jgi:predicted glutamine amidotransferase